MATLRIYLKRERHCFHTKWSEIYSKEIKGIMKDIGKSDITEQAIMTDIIRTDN